MEQKYQKKNIYLPEKSNKLLMNEDQYNDLMMEYKKIINFLDNGSNQPSKF